MTDKTMQKNASRRNRFFSDDFKRQKIKELDKNLTTIKEICQDYEVSRTAVYQWVYKFSDRYTKDVKQVVQLESEQEKTRHLKARIAELERIIGTKQMTIDLLEKMIEIGEKEFGIDIKKKFSSQRSTGSGPTKRNTSIT